LAVMSSVEEVMDSVYKRIRRDLETSLDGVMKLRRFREASDAQTDRLSVL
jgi:hypothetical protein